MSEVNSTLETALELMDEFELMDELERLLAATGMLEVEEV